MAAPVKNSAGLNHQARRMNFAGNHTLCLDFDSSLGKDDAIEFACNDHAIPFNLAFHLSAFTQNQAVAGQQISLHLGVNSKYPRRFESSLKANAFVEEACKFAALRVFASVLRSPLHKKLPQFHDCKTSKFYNGALNSKR